MTPGISPLAGKPAPPSSLIDVAKLVTAYFEIKPDPTVAVRDPGALYIDLANEFGNPVGDRVQAAASAKQLQALAGLSAHDLAATELAGEKIDSVIDWAPGDDAPIGGIKVSAASGWFAARPLDTEDIYKIYAESFRGQEQLRQILKEAQVTVDAVIRWP
jgi:phosphoglucomutase